MSQIIIQRQEDRENACRANSANASNPCNIQKIVMCPHTTKHVYIYVGILVGVSSGAWPFMISICARTYTMIQTARGPLRGPHAGVRRRARSSRSFKWPGDRLEVHAGVRRRARSSRSFTRAQTPCLVIWLTQMARGPLRGPRWRETPCLVISIIHPCSDAVLGHLANSNGQGTA